jgi:8-oxo-dGTP pyrophosphatase MutT (NUDIX family)
VSVRGVIIDERNRVLLVRITHPADQAQYWIAPGGGIEDGEDDVTALRRELAEETSLTDFDLGDQVWTWVWPDGDEFRFYLVRCRSFDPAPGPGQPPDETFDEYRWWSADELKDCRGLAPEPVMAEVLTNLLLACSAP